MTKRRKILTTALCLLALQPAATGVAVAAPKSAIGKSPVNVAPSIYQHIVNGKIEVDPGCASEFPQWTKLLEFYDRPPQICVHWIEKTKTEWAQWELYKDTDDPGDKKIASGELTGPTLNDTSSSFKIKLSDYVPLKNTGTTKQKYYVRLHAKVKARDTFVQVASPATLVHLPKAGEQPPPPGNPYSCGSAPDNYARKVKLSVPQMSVVSTSSTTGDGDRDELYFIVSQLGPGTTTKATRLPGADDYFEAFAQADVGSNGWTNQDQDHVPAPVIFNGTLKHGEKVTLSLAAMEQDNSDLKNIKDGLIDAMKGVAAAALATNTSYGAIVAAIATAIAGTTGAFVPNTAGHDFVGFVGIRAENNCGYIKTTWTTFSEKEISGVGTLTNDFVDVSTQDAFEARLATMSVESQFWPNGVDYGPYTYTGASDSFFWRAAGTHNSQYVFLLKGAVSK